MAGQRDGPRTGARAGLPDPGGLPGSVLLSYLGERAVSVAVPHGLLGHVPARDHCARTCAEQALIGLGAPQIGRVLLRTRDLPETVIASVTALDTRPVQPTAAGRDTGALCEARRHLCARRGERLAAGELASPADSDFAADGRIGLAAIRPLHADARCAALAGQLAAPALQARIEALKLDRRSTHRPQHRPPGFASAGRPLAGAPSGPRPRPARHDAPRVATWAPAPPRTASIGAHAQLPVRPAGSETGAAAAEPAHEGPFRPAAAVADNGSATPRAVGGGGRCTCRGRGRTR